MGEAVEAQAGSHSQEAYGQGGLGQQADGPFQEVGQGPAQQGEAHTARGGEDERVAENFPKPVGVSMPGQDRHGCHIGQRDQEAHEQADGGDAGLAMEGARHGQAHVAVEAEGALERRGEDPRRVAEQVLAEITQDHAGQGDRQAGDQHGQGDREVDAGPGQGMKQQGREEHEIDEPLQAAPAFLADVRDAAQQGAQQDQGKDGQDDERDGQGAGGRDRAVVRRRPPGLPHRPGSAICAGRHGGRAGPWPTGWRSRIGNGTRYRSQAGRAANRRKRACWPR